MLKEQINGSEAALMPLESSRQDLIKSIERNPPEEINSHRRENFPGQQLI